MKYFFYNKEFNRFLPVGIEYPVFALVKDGWNDYGHSILYNLIFYKNVNDEIEIGNMKILDKRSVSTALPNKFTQLDKNYCSLGQSLEFYEKLKKYFPDSFDGILNSLNDIATNSDIADAFSEVNGFSDGLLRFSSAEKAFNEAHLLLFENKKMVNENLFFTYSVIVGGASSAHIVYFDFKKNLELPYRINVIIGKNGTGKTQFLGSMVNSISGVKYMNNFSPFNPLFRKIIAISYSLFDDFPKPEETTVFSYKYIGLRTTAVEIVSDEKLDEKLKKALTAIIEKERSSIWYHSVNNIIQLENLGIEHQESLTDSWVQNLSFKNAKRLSSGQSITLFILTELIAYIEDESLILFDEPETHLHPSAISQLMNSFYEILEYYKSFAILSTHSPIIVQDIPSNYITIFDRQGNIPIIRKLPLESFGENISTLTSKIFGTIDVKELYKKYLEQISDNTQEEIESLFIEGLSINAQLYLAAMKNKNLNEKS